MGFFIIVMQVLHFSGKTIFGNFFLSTFSLTDGGSPKLIFQKKNYLIFHYLLKFYVSEQFPKRLSNS